MAKTGTPIVYEHLHHVWLLQCKMNLCALGWWLPCSRKPAVGLGGGSVKPVFLEEIGSSGKREWEERDKKIDAVAQVKRMKCDEIWDVEQSLLWESKGMFVTDVTAADLWSGSNKGPKYFVSPTYPWEDQAQGWALFFYLGWAFKA